MANGFPKPSRQASFPAAPTTGPTRLTSSSPSAPAPAEPSATQQRSGVLRSLAPWCGLAAASVAALLFINRQPPEAATSPAPNARQAQTQQPGPLVAPAMRSAQAPRAPSPAIAAASPETAPQPFVSNDPQGVPEAYTGDPEGQALWEKVVEEEQQTVQPDDLIEDPRPPGIDLTKIPAYQAEHIDADGNLN